MSRLTSNYAEQSAHNLRGSVGSVTEEEDDRWGHATDTENDSSARSKVASQSPFMVRQLQRQLVTGLSPIEEMQIAQNELRVKAAAQLPSRRLQNSLSSLITTRDIIHKLRKGQKVAPDTRVDDFDDEKMIKEVDQLTPAEALDFVEIASRNENVLSRKKQQYDEMSLPFYLISPHSKFRMRWDVLAFSLITYNAIMIPFQLSFWYHIPLNGTSLETFHRFVDGFFYVDIVINFFSSYEVNGRIENRSKAIAKRYIKSWFLIDFISSFPVYIFQGNVGRMPQLARLFRLFRLFKLIRMLTIVRILNRLEYALLIRSTVSSIAKFFLIVCFTSHWLSCSYFWISIERPDGWVASNGLEHAKVYDKYTTAFYWSIMTMTTVGYGDIYPTSTDERVFCIFGMLFGAWIFTYAITSAVAMVANLNASNSEYQLRMDELNDYMEARELPMPLRYEIREFYSNARSSEESKLANESKILAELSALLRSKVAFAINDRALSQMPFFEGADHNFLMELALSMRMVCLPPMEEVILEGEKGEEMFFIFRGVVEIERGGQQLGVLGQKQYFGEMALFNLNCLRTATVRTLCFCELRMLTREKFLIALTHFPDMKQRIAKIVEKRAKASSASVPMTSSPLPDERASMVEGSLDRMAESIVKNSNANATTARRTTPQMLSRVSQMNTQFSNSMRLLQAEADLNSMQTRLKTMVKLQDDLTVTVQEMEMVGAGH